MATLVDRDDFKEDNRPEDEEISALPTEDTEVRSEEPEAPQEDDLPDKYQGKSATELAKMHANLEQLMGKQSQEVGELRQAFDEMVKSSMTQRNTAPEPEVEEDIDYWSDPKAAIEKTLANHPTLKQAQQVAIEMAKKESVAALQSAHPDMKEIIADTKFQEWANSRKSLRDLFQRADQNYDYQAASDLLDLWKERANVVKQTAAVEKVAQKNEVKKAATGTSRSNPDGQSSKKIYRRRDIIELMNKDPKRYEALQPEIMKAYSEGRVR